MKEKKQLSNHIEEYFAQQEGNKDFLVSRELFKLDDDLDIKTELKLQEIQLITTLMFNDDILRTHGLKPVYNNFLKNYMRLKISLDRKSRGEYVQMSRPHGFDSKNLNGIENIKDAKK